MARRTERDHRGNPSVRRPLVIDLGEGSKNLILTVEQVRQDGAVLERRRLLVGIGVDDKLFRPQFGLLTKLLGADQQEA